MHPRHLADPPRPRAPAGAIYVPQRHCIRRWHVVISGFTQNEGRPNGSELLWSMLRQHDRGGNGTCTTLRPWNSPWDNFAEMVWRFRPLEAPPEVHVYAYSWGAGWGFPRLAHELGKRSLAIDTAVLSDAVYRNPLWSLAWLSLCRLPRIAVPPNVREVYWFFQRTNRPAGHTVVAADPERTIVHQGREARATHNYMDDLPAFYQQSLAVAHQAAQRGYRPPEAFNGEAFKAAWAAAQRGPEKSTDPAPPRSECD